MRNRTGVAHPLLRGEMSETLVDERSKAGLPARHEGQRARGSNGASAPWQRVGSGESSPLTALALLGLLHLLEGG
jgi:hypothetical protein